MFVEVIRKKRDGGVLTPQDIQQFVQGLSDNSLGVEQIAALAMAICVRSMTDEETFQLTKSMAESGRVLEWGSNLNGPVLDKHSTGGVGDKVSLMLAPIIAACGGYVPMISGRGLGHSGGTLDKLASIPGYNTVPDMTVFQDTVRDVGCAIVGQSVDLAPADGRLYAVRDVSGTVESVPLITASILSKKYAAGLSGLVMDIKVGTGAFMRELEDAQALGECIIETARRLGLTCHALVTDMNQVLGNTAGNALEVKEAVEFLANKKREPRLNEVVLSLAGELLYLAGLVSSQEVGESRADKVICTGHAAEVFDRMVCALGGPADFMEGYSNHLQTSAVSKAVYPKQSGVLREVDTKAIGLAIVELGGGRKHIEDELDLAVGFSEIAPIGQSVDTKTPLAIVHAGNEADATMAGAAFSDACGIATDTVTHTRLPTRSMSCRMLKHCSSTTRLSP
ncbi:MAG: thymidine phosphorylase [Pseudomonadota bacterium]